MMESIDISRGGLGKYLAGLTVKYQPPVVHTQDIHTQKIQNIPPPTPRKKLLKGRPTDLYQDYTVFFELKYPSDSLLNVITSVYT